MKRAVDDKGNVCVVAPRLSFDKQKRRAAQEVARKKQEDEAQQAKAAAEYAAAHTSELLTNVFDGLVADGHFFDPLTREVRGRTSCM